MAGALSLPPAPEDEAGLEESPPRWRPIGLLLVALLVASGLLAAAGIGRTSPTTAPVDQTGAALAQAAHSPDAVTILAGAPSTLDPARQGDLGSAQVTSQLFESLTAVDASLHVQPALASSWDVLDQGRTVVFHLRPDLEFSDGSPLRAADVVASWMRIIDPSSPSPLASLLDEVEGVDEHLRGGSGSSAPVGIQAQGNNLVVRLRRPTADFPEIAANPSLGVVPPSIDSQPRVLSPGTFVGSGAYVISAQTDVELTLVANPHYWAGLPAIKTVHLVQDTGGRTPVQLFSDGSLDYTDIGFVDAAWIAYDSGLGPSLRATAPLSVDYYGFDTRKPPFDDARVRLAFAEAVDWSPIVDLAVGDQAKPATGMVPPGIPGRGMGSYGPSFDPTDAKALLAQAGYPEGRGFPQITLVTAGSPYDPGVARQLEDNLGIKVGLEIMAGNDYFTRLQVDPPAFWALSWVADYAGPNDFLGMLLGTGQSNNYGRWSSPDFDRAIADAGSTTDPAAVVAAFDRAQKIVQRDVPVIPVSYSTGWALARTGLLGAQENGLGLLRFAGLAWGPGR